MDRDALIRLLEAFKENRVTSEEVLQYIKSHAYADLGYAKVDTHRKLRWGFPEVIYCPGKKNEAIIGIIGRILESGNNVLATRATIKNFQAVKEIYRDAVYHEPARCITISIAPVRKRRSKVLVITAGTADIPVAEEAVICAEYMGLSVERLYDVGVAGLHRLLDNHEMLSQASVIIVVAGMEGALASVIGGLVDKPVVAVPTSTGYGASFNGLAALLAMLNSCAAGVGVVNIDNGFGAAALAHSIINQIEVSR